MRTAIYPGTFDPITHGHIDVIRKSLKIVDRVVVAATDNINKDYFFSVEERVSIIKNSLFKDLKLNKKRILIVPFEMPVTSIYNNLAQKGLYLSLAHHTISRYVV